MTLAEWHAAKYWFNETLTGKIRELAWSISYLMRATGCDADQVTPSKLLGEPEPVRRELNGFSSTKEAQCRSHVGDASSKNAEDRGNVG
jgi:hypothetical protein